MKSARFFGPGPKKTGLIPAILLGASLFITNGAADTAPDPVPALPLSPHTPIEAATPTVVIDSLAASGGGLPGDVDLNLFLGATRFYDNSYTGTRAVLANIEAGVVWDGHQDFNTSGHVNYMTPVGSALSTAASIDLHATAVSGMMVARGGAAYPANPFRWGIAHGAEFWTGGIASSWAAGPSYSLSFSTDVNTIGLTYEQALVAGMGASNVTADVVNGSWGVSGAPASGTTSGYTVDGFIMDTLARESRSLLVFSAGNSGPDGNTVGSPATAYNTLAVGALQGPAFDQLATSSSRSPSDIVSFETGSPVLISGVRAAVDLVAPGTAVFGPFYGGETGGNQTGAPLSGWTPANDNSYLISSGTSYSAPLVAGGATLLVDAGRDVYASDPVAIDALVLKAVLLNSADKLPGWNNAQSEVAQAGGQYGTDTVLRTSQTLDYGFGAGRMNLDRAFDQYMPTSNGGLAVTANVGSNITGNLGSVGAVGWDFGSIQLGTPNTYFISDMLLGGSIFSTTLTWFADRDYALTPAFAEIRFSDLNLSLFAYDPLDMSILGTVAESISIYNLVEHLWFDLPDSGYYGIQVDYSEDLWNFAADLPVNYGLAWSGSLTVIPEPGRAALVLISFTFILVRRRRPGAGQPD